MLTLPLTCRVCQKEKEIPYPTIAMGQICDECKEKQAAKDKQRFLEDLRLMSLEQRVARIEALLYDKSLRE